MRTIWIIFLLAVLGLQGCGGKEEREDGPSAEQLYEDASRALNAQNYPAAIQLYRNLTIRYPFGRHAEQAMLDMAFAQFKGGENDAAIETLNRFLRTYPTHPNVDYAWYLQGLVNYEQTMGFLRRMMPGRASDRDQQAAHQSFRDFQELIRRHPESRYVADARQRMVFLRNIMAEYEVQVGEYYERRKAWIASLNRARYVIENYPGSPATIDALKLMARAYEKLNMPELAVDTRDVLQNSYADLMDDNKREGLLRRLWPFD
ncbi:MAG TPA: outer membrane protein assembly factor BamD [Wenzhouxiangellaceae bacterium]|nr:outer membrane protein assembly factor BamD [Wenzhouxiangellaceae bacterium]